MNTTEFNEAKTLWKMFYASECFRRAKASAQHILKEKLENGHPLFYPLLCATYILYGKPFTVWHGVGRLEESMVPKEYLALHTMLMDHRHKLYAHTDANASPVPDLGPPNQVRVAKRMVGTQQFMQLYAVDFHPMYTAMQPVITLCEILEQKANYHVKKQWDKHKSTIPLEVGEYMLNVLNEKGAMWLPAQP
jgi:hypothetical protein